MAVDQTIIDELAGAYAAFMPVCTPGEGTWPTGMQFINATTMTLAYATMRAAGAPAFQGGFSAGFDRGFEGGQGG